MILGVLPAITSEPAIRARPRRKIKRKDMRHILGIVFGLMLAFGSVTPGLSHSKMSKSVPSEGQTIQPGLSEITLGFSKSVRVMVVKVYNTTMATESKAELKPARNFATSYVFPVAPLNPGAHEVSWTAVAKDGHVMKGTLKFTVKD